MKEKIKAFFASIGYMLIYLAAQLGVTFIGGIVVSIAYFATQATNIINEENINDAAIENALNVVLSYTNVFVFISSVISVLIFILIYKIRKRNYKEELQIKNTSKFNIVYALFLGITCFLLNTGVMDLIYNAGLFREHFEYTNNMLAPLSSGNIIVAIISVGIVVPFAEEFLFRGIVYNTLRKKVSIKWTIIIQGILFGVFHMNLVQGTYATILGILFGYVTYKTKSLWPAVIMHVVNNTVATVVPYLVGEDFGGVLISIIFAIIGAIGVAIFTILIKKKNLNSEEVIEFNNINGLN